MKGMRAWDACAALRLLLCSTSKLWPLPVSGGEMKGQRRVAELEYRNSMLCLCFFSFFLTLPDLVLNQILLITLFMIRSVFFGTWCCEGDVTIRLKSFFSYTVG